MRHKLHDAGPVTTVACLGVVLGVGIGAALAGDVPVQVAAIWAGLFLTACFATYTRGPRP